MPFIINEDNALKQYIKGKVKVADLSNALRPVDVWFGHPDLEVRAQSYPYITIDLIDVPYDASRAQSGIDELPYVPEGFPALAAGETYFSETPIPVNIQYQITAYSRHPRHDREILYQMFMLFPFQYGGMAGLEVPEDNTVRRVVLTRFGKRDVTDSDKKRLYVSVFDVYVESEMNPWQVYKILQAHTATVTTNVFVNTDVITPA